MYSGRIVVKALKTLLPGTPSAAAAAAAATAVAVAGVALEKIGKEPYTLNIVKAAGLGVSCGTTIANMGKRVDPFEMVITASAGAAATAAAAAVGLTVRLVPLFIIGLVVAATAAVAVRAPKIAAQQKIFKEVYPHGDFFGISNLPLEEQREIEIKMLECQVKNSRIGNHHFAPLSGVEVYMGESEKIIFRQQYIEALNVLLQGLKKRIVETLDGSAKRLIKMEARGVDDTYREMLRCVGQTPVNFATLVVEGQESDLWTLACLLRPKSSSNDGMFQTEPTGDEAIAANSNRKFCSKEGLWRISIADTLAKAAGVPRYYPDRDMDSVIMLRSTWQVTMPSLNEIIFYMLLDMGPPIINSSEEADRFCTGVRYGSFCEMLHASMAFEFLIHSERFGEDNLKRFAKLGVIGALVIQYESFKRIIEASERHIGTSNEAIQTQLGMIQRSFVRLFRYLSIEDLQEADVEGHVIDQVKGLKRKISGIDADFNRGDYFMLPLQGMSQVN